MTSTYNPYDHIPCMDITTATHRIKKLETRVEELERLVHRMDNFIKYQYFRGTTYTYANTEGPGHGKGGGDTYYPRFDTRPKGGD